jgi:Ca2+-binding RTX toxin-like protein
LGIQFALVKVGAAGLATGALPLLAIGTGCAIVIGHIIDDSGMDVMTREELLEIFRNLNDLNFSVINDQVIYTGYSDMVYASLIETEGIEAAERYLQSFQKSLDAIINAAPPNDSLRCYCDDPLARPYPPEPPCWPGRLTEEELNRLKDLIGSATTAFNPSPLILDLDGDGVETTPLGDLTHFDHDGNGFAERSGWVSPDDALLVRDINGDGKITSGAELFGNHTNDDATNGFEALAELDSNGDGIIDSNDAAWNQLHLWRDLNGDGIVDDGELMTLEEAGVAGLNTDYMEQTYIDEHGNEHRQAGSYIKTDGTIADMTDVWFATDPIYHVELDPVEVSDDILVLPDVKGYGILSSFHQAMARDETGYLQGLVEQFVAETDIDARRALTETIVFAWAGITDTASMRGAIQEGKLVALEKFLSREFRQNGNPNPGAGAVGFLEDAFDILTNFVYSSLSFQSHYQDLYIEAAASVLIADILETPFDASSLLNSLRAIYDDDNEMGVEVVKDFMKSLRATEVGVTAIEAIRVDWGRMIPNGIDSFEFALAYGWADVVDSVVNGVLRGVSGKDSLLFGGAGDESLIGDTGNDIVFGGSGDDLLQGGSGNDLLHGEAGDDRLEGGKGDDVYIFNLGDGHDVISDYESNRPAKRNVIRFGEGISEDSLEFTLKANATSGYMDLVILIKETGETVTVERGICNSTVNASNSYSIQAIEYADGTVWEWSDIAARPMHLAGTISNATVYALAEGGILVGNENGNVLQGTTSVANTLYGGAGDDTLKGGNLGDVLYGEAGDDRLEGGAGNDVYLFNLGDGHDVIYEYENRVGKNNVVKLGEGIAVDDIELLAKPTNGNYSDLIIRIKSTGETITVLNGMLYNTANSSNYYSIQSIEFADGTVWEWSDISAQPMTVAEGSYNNYGYAASEGGILHGNSADNKMWGSAKADALYGGAGNDTLLGDAGADLLHGGLGIDRLEGGAGDDVYLFNLGDGHDVIYEYENRSGKNNVVKLGEGIAVDDIELLAKPTNGNNSDLIIRIKSTGETITALNGMLYNTANSSNSYSIQVIEFADGTVWEWSDISAQPMTVMEGSYNNYGYAASEGGILHGNSADNKMWGSAKADALYGGAGADTLLGDAGADLLHGGLGIDRLEGGAGDDAYLFDPGDGQDTIYDTAGTDSLIFGDDVDIADLWFTRSGNNLIINVADPDNSVTVQNWYSGASYKVESIQSGGMELVHTQMDQLIQALASFGAPAGVDGGWTEEQKEALQPIIATYWHPLGS